MLFFYKKICYTYYMVGDFMKKSKQKKENNRSKFVSLLVVIIIFSIAFILLIKAQQQNVYYNAKNDFNIKTKAGKTIVAKDTQANYPKYYVVYTTNGEYSIYVYNYYETESQYELEFNRLLDSIVDYNANTKMIRYLHSKGYGTYTEVYNNLTTILETERIEIY